MMVGLCHLTKPVLLTISAFCHFIFISKPTTTSFSIKVPLAMTLSSELVISM
jgi:hypothetical protein